jgi:SagB-type dehydrogenase family enzyme
MLLRQLSPATAHALARLPSPGLRLGELVADLQQVDRARLLYWLHELAARGCLLLTVAAGQDRLATADSLPRGFRLGQVQAPAGPLVLSRFAWLRRLDSHLIVEIALSAARVVLHDERAVRFVHSGTADLPAEAVVSLRGLLFHSGMLIPPGEEADSLRTWEFHDLLFHARSRGGRHDAPFGATFHFLGRLEPPPAVKPPLGAATVELYRPDLARLEREDPPLAQVMESRCSLRGYGPTPIAVEQLGEFLYRVARVRHRSNEEIDTPDGTMRMDMTSRPYPAGGSLYELELYPVVQSCRGLDAGLYHYDPEGHRLERVAESTAAVEGLLEGAALAAGIEAAQLQVLIVLAARFARVQWKYSSLAYALTLKNVGVLYQSMYLAATAMKLAPCALGAGDADLFARAAGTDYYAETSVGEFLLGSRAEELKEQASRG